MYKVAPQLARYLLAGGALFILDLSIVYLLVKFQGLHPAVAQMIGRACGAAAGFLIHRQFTFGRRAYAPFRHRVAWQGVGYLGVAVATFLFSPIVLLFFLRTLSENLVLAKILTEIVLVVLTFVALKMVFGHQEYGNGRH